jgi:hypothetical protein
MNPKVQEYAIAGLIGGIIAVTVSHLVEHVILGHGKKDQGTTQGAPVTPKVTTMQSSRIHVSIGPYSAGRIA